MAVKEEDWAVIAAKKFAASASAEGLVVPIDAVADVFRQITTAEPDLSGIEPVYSTEEAACFFGKSPQWLYWGMKPRVEGEDPTGGGLFYYPDGRPIEPQRIGKKGIRRFTLDVIKDMSVALYQRGTIKPDELKEIIRRIHLARTGQWVPDPKKAKGNGSKGEGGS